VKESFAVSWATTGTEIRERVAAANCFAKTTGFGVRPAARS
jgi:hypothetical protein